MKRVVIFGSINLDLVTKVGKHPKPGETISGTNCQTLAGGKGANQALATSYHSNISTFMIGAVGKDSFAAFALSNLINSNLNTERIERLESISTGVALIAVDQNGENTIIVTPGANHSVTAKQLTALDIKSGDVILTQNELLETQTYSAHQLAKNSGATVIHNAAPAHKLSFEQMNNIDYLITNETELIIVTNGFNIDETDPIKSAQALAKKFETNIIVTLGGNGAILVSKTQTLSQPATKIKVVDTTGAGDAFCGTFAANIANNIELAEALKNSIHAGGQACTTFGAQKATSTDS